ncbi:MAG: hypothetical protein U0163_21725 [Gemmatimonadaceae bacterium]
MTMVINMHDQGHMSRDDHDLIRPDSGGSVISIVRPETKPALRGLPQSSPSRTADVSDRVFRYVWRAIERNKRPHRELTQR